MKAGFEGRVHIMLPCYILLAHLSHSLKVSLCVWSLSSTYSKAVGTYTAQFAFSSFLSSWVRCLSIQFLSEFYANILPPYTAPHNYTHKCGAFAGSSKDTHTVRGEIFKLTHTHYMFSLYDKQDDFNFEIVNFPFLDGDVPRTPSYGVYISQLIRFARVCSNVDDFNNRNLFLPAKLLKQVYRYHKIRKAFSKFYHRHSELIVKYNIGLKHFCNKPYQNLYFMVI